VSPYFWQTRPKRLKLTPCTTMMYACKIKAYK